ncbi:pilus assembly protein TadG-related protein [Nocardioides taihuensis]|uniref:Pilus assembly protein TadG-related protein n=1 Tax=Nocardioides taihuensis TaxID=1835606 RepID=A0ABW0BLA1_9ACTN
MTTPGGAPRHTTRTPPTAREPRSEAGQATLLIVGLAVLLLTMTAVVVDASAAFLRRQSLDTLADGAALAGADAGSANLDLLYDAGLDATRLAQAEPAARAAVAAYLRDTGALATYPGLTWTLDVDGTDVVVELAAPLDLPLTVPGAPATTTVGASARAAVVVD